MIVLSIPDLHFPFEHRDALDFIRDVYKDIKPDEVVCLGDELDIHAISDHGSDPNGLSPGDEFEAGMLCMRSLYKIFKGQPIKFCTSNHTSRPFRRAFKAGIPTQFLRDYRDFLEAPDGCEWRDEWVIDGVLYIHGEGFSGQNGAIKAAMSHRQSVVLGHLHSYGGIIYHKSRNGQIFGLNAGCLIDENKYAFRYGKKMPGRPTLGCALIEDGVKGHFIPMTK